MNILQKFKWGFLEEIAIEDCGIIRVKGWSIDNIPDLKIKLKAGDIFYSTSQYRTYRPDIPKNIKTEEYFLGFVVEFLCFEPCDLYYKEQKLYSINHKAYHADYESLLFTSGVLHRDNIYTYGPPVKYISEPVEKLILSLKGSVLDFGCGIGMSVSKLRENNIEAYGIELFRDAIAKGLKEDVSEYITLYDGNFPTSYKDDSFDNIICVEVLEHIPNYVEAIKEFSRLTKRKLIITVPDISAIPILHKHGVVPWHLLESTHVNFFNQHSLRDLLIKLFPNVNIIKINPFEINGTTVFTNLVAICEKE